MKQEPSGDFVGILAIHGEENASNEWKDLLEFARDGVKPSVRWL